MSEKNYFDKMNLEIIEDVMEDIISIYTSFSSA